MPQNESPIKAMVFDGSYFFLRSYVNSLISICVSDFKDQKLPVSAIKTRIDNNGQKILLARQAHKSWKQLSRSNYGPNRAMGRLLMSNPDCFEITSKSDQQFLRRFFKDFFMSIYCKKPPFTRAMLMDESRFPINFWKGSAKEYSCEIILKSDQLFQRRICSCLYSARSSHSPEPYFWTDHNFANNFWKGSL